MVTAIFRKRAYRVLEDDGQDRVELEDWTTGARLWVDYGDPDLEIDPMYVDWCACENIQEDA